MIVDPESYLRNKNGYDLIVLWESDIHNDKHEGILKGLL